ncbi:MAG: DEAD/DEAH box helicase [Micrococcales bacterium]
MPKIGKTNARAAKTGASKSTSNSAAPKKTHRKGGASAAESAAPKRGAAGAGKFAGKGAAPKRSYKEREDGRGGRAPHRDADVRPARKPRAAAAGREDRFERDARPARKFDGERPARKFDDRPAKSSRFGGDDRAPRGAKNDGRRDWEPREKPARGARKFDDARGSRDDRPAKSSRFGGDERPARKYDDERPARKFDGDRPAKSSRFGGDDRPARKFDGDRPAKSSRFGGDDRPARKFDDRPKRRFDDERAPQRADRVERDRDRDRSFDGARQSNPNKKAFFEDTKLERLESVDASTVEMAGSFGDMDLHPKMVIALASMGAESPFPIQAATIPAAIGGMDVLGRGKTGSGKTVAFTVPLIMKLIAAGSQPRKAGKPRALILAPTRELADQIDRTVQILAKSVGFYTTCIYGGVPQRRQENAMSRGTDIVVATPGRLEDLMAQGIVDLSEVETIVIDEADHMCDLGFIEPVKRIMRATGDSQKLLFSATLDKEVDALVREFLPAPFVYEVPNEDEDTSNIVHRVLIVDQEDRSQVLLRLVQGHGKSLIFARTKMTAERLSESLTAAGVPAARLHGDLNQNQRNRNLERFTKGYVRVLVATDVAARGIHVDDVALVVQVDPPEEYKTYLHRAGRTGRAGKEGTVVTLIPRTRRRRMEQMLDRADRDGIFTEVRPTNALLEQLAGPIAPPPAQEELDFGDSRGGGSRGGDRRGGNGGRARAPRDRDRGPRSGGDRKFGGDKKFGDRPKRDFSDRPKRDFGDKPRGSNRAPRD